MIKHAFQKIVPKSPGSEKSRVLKIKEYIQDYHDTDISLKDLSRMTGISRYYLLRVFERESGMTPGQFSEKKRKKNERDRA